jgi:signal transduction histidine kinase
LGTLGLIFVAFAVVCVNFLLLHLTYLWPRILVIGLLAGFMTALYARRHQYYRFAAYSLLVFYFVAATGAIVIWGGETPVGVLLFALVIIFSGILLGARFSLYALCLSVAILAIFTILARAGVVQPDMSWASRLAGIYDIAVFAIILGNLALVSWLFNRSMERSLGRARRSEQALRRQKQLLEVKVEERTRQVQAAHMERVQEMYRFAELGHISVALLHDVANYLSVLSLDIEDLKETRRNRSAVMERVQESIHHLNSLISNVRHQVKG